MISLRLPKMVDAVFSMEEKARVAFFPFLWYHQLLEYA